MAYFSVEKRQKMPTMTSDIFSKAVERALIEEIKFKLNLN